MPTTTTINKPPQLAYRYFECAGARDEYLLWPLTTVTRAENSMESRVRPPSPLYLYPTNQALQWTEVKTNGYYKSADKTLVSQPMCNGAPFKVYRDAWTGATGTIVKQTPRPDTNWALKMRLRIKDASVNLGATVGEYRQTASMFNKFAVGVHEALRTYRSVKRLRFRPRPCDIAAAELLGSFGVMPLVRDLYASVEALQDRLSNPIYYRFYAKDRVVEPFETNGVVGQWEVEQRAVAYVRYEAEEGYSSFTMGNPLELAWELQPFSFVVDWAIPIGDYLSSLDALKGVHSLTGTLVTKSWYNHVRVTPPSAGKTWIRPPSMLYFDHRRDVLSTIPLPRVPTYSPSRSWRAIVHGVSLLSVLNKKCYKRD